MKEETTKYINGIKEWIHDPAKVTIYIEELEQILKADDKAEKVCLKAFEEIRQSFENDKYTQKDMNQHTDKMVYNFLISIGYQKIATEWFIMVADWNHRADNWIPVSDETLPDPLHLRVNIYSPEYGIKESWYQCKIDNDHYWNIFTAKRQICITGVTHWKSLPEVPE